MAEAYYCYKNSSIYFNSHISDEDIEEFAIHECIHFLQEQKDKNNNIKRMGLAKYNRLKTFGIGLNEAAVQYFSSIIIGISPDFEKYYGVSIYTPSPSYYPIECALLNELVYFIGEESLFQSTFFSNNSFKNEIIKRTSKKTYKNIITSFDNILNYEEKIFDLNNKLMESDDSIKIEDSILKYRDLIYSTFVETQNMIIKEFFDYEFSNIKNFSDLEAFRIKISKFENILGIADTDNFYSDYLLEMINKMEHLAEIFENNENETALIKIKFSLFKKLKSLFFSKLKTDNN